MLFNKDCYKEIIKDYIQSSPGGGRGLNAQIAKSLNCHTSLVSQVLNGAKDFTPEQGIKLSRFMGLSPLEEKYFINLIQLQRSGEFQLTDFYKEEKLALRKEGQRMKNQLKVNKHLSLQEATQYYSDSLYSLVRMCVSMSTISSIEEMQEYLGVSKERLLKVLNFLVQHQLIRVDGNYFKAGERITHIDKNSPIINLHHRNWRLKALQAQEAPAQNDLFFSVPMAISKKDIPKIKVILESALKDVYEVIRNSGDEDICCLNIDWFQVNPKERN